MRIVGGSWRGRALASVGKGDPAAHLRPTTDRVRESLFNMLIHRFDDPVSDAVVLDLFAGTGALGLEALSRGAARATFVESGRKGAGLIRQNLSTLGAEDQSKLIVRDATKLPKGTPHSLVFLDPPYGKGLGQKALSCALAGGWLQKGALVVWEEDAPQLAPDGFEPIETRAFGNTHATFLTVA